MDPFQSFVETRCFSDLVRRQVYHLELGWMEKSALGAARGPSGVWLTQYFSIRTRGEAEFDHIVREPCRSFNNWLSLNHRICPQLTARSHLLRHFFRSIRFLWSLYVCWLH